jgi:hypothetical protein
MRLTELPLRTLYSADMRLRAKRVLISRCADTSPAQLSDE